MMVDESSQVPVIVNSVLTADLAWDYTGDETSPLLRNAAARLNRSNQKCVMTRRQVEYLIHSVHEVSQILTNELYRCNNHHANVNNSNSSNHSSIYRSYCCRYLSRKCTFLKYLVNYSVLIALVFQVLAILVDSLIDLHSISHKPYTSCAFFVLSTFFLILHYVKLATQLHSYEHVRLSTLCASCLTTMLLFASIYTSMQQFQFTSPPLFIVAYLKNVHISISVLTLTYYGQLDCSNWPINLLLTIEMILSYVYTILITSNVIVFVFTSYKNTSAFYHHPHPHNNNNNNNNGSNDNLLENPSQTELIGNDDAGSLSFNAGLYGSLDLSDGYTINVDNNNAVNVNRNEEA